MNTTDLLMLLLLLVSGSLGVAIIVSAGNVIMGRLRQAKPVPISKAADDPKFDRRRKIDTNPNIACLLPMYQQKRPQQRLW